MPDNPGRAPQPDLSTATPGDRDALGYPVGRPPVDGSAAQAPVYPGEQPLTPTALADNPYGGTVIVERGYYDADGGYHPPVGTTAEQAAAMVNTENAENADTSVPQSETQPHAERGQGGAPQTAQEIQGTPTSDQPARGDRPSGMPPSPLGAENNGDGTENPPAATGGAARSPGSAPPSASRTGIIPRQSTSTGRQDSGSRGGHRQRGPQQEKIPMNLHQWAVQQGLDYLSPDFADQIALDPSVRHVAQALATANRALRMYSGKDEERIAELRSAVDERITQLESAVRGQMSENLTRSRRGSSREELHRQAIHETATALVYSVHCEVMEARAGRRDIILEAARATGRIMGSRVMTAVRRTWMIGGIAAGILTGAVGRMLFGAAAGAATAAVAAPRVRRGVGRLQARSERHQIYNTAAGMSRRATALLTAIRMPGEDEGTYGTLMSNAGAVMVQQGEASARANYRRRRELVDERVAAGSRGRDIGMGAARGLAGGGWMAAALDWDTLAHNLSNLSTFGNTGAEQAILHDSVISSAQTESILTHFANADPSQLDGMFGDGHRIISIQDLTQQDFGHMADPGEHHGYASGGMSDLGSTNPMADIRQAIDQLAPYEDQGLLSVQEYTTADGSTAFRLVVPQDLVINVAGENGTSATIFVPAGGVDGLGYYPGVYQAEIYQAVLHGGKLLSVDQAISQIASGDLPVDPTWLAEHADIIRSVPGFENFTVPITGTEATPTVDAAPTTPSSPNLGNLEGAGAGVASGTLGTVIRNPRYVAPGATVVDGSRSRYPTVAEAGAPAAPREQAAVRRGLQYPTREGYGRGIESYIDNPATGSFFVEELDQAQQRRYVRDLANASGLYPQEIRRRLLLAAANDNDADDSDDEDEREGTPTRGGRRT